MKITFALLIIVLLTFSGYHLTFRNFRLPLFARQFYLTGTEFLFLGLLLGPQFLNLIDTETQKGLAPLSALLLGWIGLIFGFQFEITKLKRFPPEYLIAAVIGGLVTLALVFAAVYPVLPLFITIANPMKIVVSLTLAAAAACTAQTGLVLMAPDYIGKCRNMLRLLRYISSIDGISALLVFGLAFFFRPSLLPESSWIDKLSSGAIAGLLACIGLLLLFTLFLNRRRQESELLLIVIGMTVLSSGMASTLNFSPLLTNFFIGFWVVNLSREKERIYHILIMVEKPTYLLLLVFLGVNWHFDSASVLLWAAVYCLYRLFAKLAAGYLVTGLMPKLGDHTRQLGFGLLAQGGLSIAILLDFQQRFSSAITPFVVSFALLTIIYNDLLSPHFLNHLLTRKP